MKLIELLLNNGGSLMDIDANGCTGFEAAIFSGGHSNICDLLHEPLDYYDTGALCATVLKKMHWHMRRLLSLRSFGIPTDILESTAIGIAANMGDMNILRELLDHFPPGSNVIIPTLSESFRSYEKGLQKGLQYELCETSYHFWRETPDNLGSPLTLAALGGLRAVDATEELLRIGCEPDIFTWCTRATECLLKHRKRLDNCVTRPTIMPVQSPLLRPIFRGERQLIKSLVKAGADVNYHSKSLNGSARYCNSTPLNYAIESKDLDTITLLLEAGAKVNKRCPYMTPCNSPLKAAIKEKSPEIITCLLKAGADVNGDRDPPHYRHSPLQLAAKLGNLDVLDCLLEAGADVNAPGRFARGGTALQLAALHGYLGVVKQLIDLGAEINAPRSQEDGRTALEGAGEHGRLDVLELLFHHGVLTTGRGRRQYFVAVALAISEGRTAARDLLRDHHNWTEQDEALLHRVVEVTNAEDRMYKLDDYFGESDDFVRPDAYLDDEYDSGMETETDFLF